MASRRQFLQLAGRAGASAALLGVPGDLGARKEPVSKASGPSHRGLRGALGTDATLGVVTVSPIGLSTSGVTVPNNGADFGPDTPGQTIEGVLTGQLTTTSGIQEALNSLPTTKIVDSNNNSVTGSYGWVQLLNGIFECSRPIVIPNGTIRLRGIVNNGWVPTTTGIGSLSANTGDTVIISTANVLGPPYPFYVAPSPAPDPEGGLGYNACILDIGDFEFRCLSPESPEEEGIAFSLDHLRGGFVSNLMVWECDQQGSVGNNINTIISLIDPGQQCGGVEVSAGAAGGFFGFNVWMAHINMHDCAAFLQRVGAGGSGTGASAFRVQPQQGNRFDSLQAYASPYGITVNATSYASVAIFSNVMFEACGHYLGLAQYKANGVILVNPCWDEAPDPTSDITDVWATSLPACSALPIWAIGTGSSPVASGMWVISRYENLVSGVTGSDWHVAVPGFGSAATYYTGTDSEPVSSATSLAVDSTSGFLSSGGMCAVAVGTGSASTWQFKGWATMSYTGISGGNTLTGTSLISGSGQLVNEGNPFWYNSPVVNLSFSLSGATAPYTFQFPFDTYFKVTTAGSISSLTFNKNLIATSLTVGTVYFVPAGTKVTLAAPSSATSFANPPVFQITPT